MKGRERKQDWAERERSRYVVPNEVLATLTECSGVSIRHEICLEVD